MGLGIRGNEVSDPDAYARRAYEAECALAASTSHGRNDQLNRSSYAVGQLVGAGVIDRGEAESGLFTAAQASGYVAKDGAPAARSTIKSGLDQGIHNPREGLNGPRREPQRHENSAAGPKPRQDNAPLPAWTEPGADERPKLYAIGAPEPTIFSDEARRHLYWRGGQCVRAKIKKQAGVSLWSDVYRVRRPADGAIGWQAKKPAGFEPVAYVGPQGTPDPFGPDRAGQDIVWAEGEKDVDALQTRGVLAFTFGSASDVPDCGDLLAGRRVILCADRDPAGEKCITRRVAVLTGKAASLHTVMFPEFDKEGFDASDFFEAGHTAADFVARAKVVSAQEQASATQAAPQDGKKADDLVRVPFKTVAKFVGEYEPLSYVIEPTVRTGSLYSLTAKTGAGKTAWMIAAALAVATGRKDILNLEVERGRVAYCCFENPDDIRMRLAISAFLLNVDLREIGDSIMVLDMRVKPEAVLAELRDMTSAYPFSLVFVDTLAAFFDGDDINNAVQGGEFIRRMRPMTQLPGKPAVVVAAHPVKNASEDQIVPYGSGAILNEVDGNLTLWRKPEGGTVRFHWQGKLRGLEFEPAEFRFEVSGCPGILDAKGRQVQIPTMLPAKDLDVEHRAKADIDLSIALLQAMLDQPKGTTRQWADTLKSSQSLVMRRLPKMKIEKLVDQSLGHWTVTKRGMKEVEKWA
ncbi:AAA family ATPase [Lichenihabitans sp. Uapishka_5]|uniref:AAA family ATPase n=1 Tax=Lichenihabitans sp. Uapishka_5 TaxID=3037302 RepID=UPI0029E81CE0|nr:AAA family ATPase [Lichenihabitans sp. Uapishka_5]MDX7953394.1 AAA family ATPase [Lichenihabitans sp. Uapishka_5]